MAKQAVLLVNLGSPDSTAVADVKRYLTEFLSDERVIDVWFVRKVIIPGIVLQTRPKKSAEAYASVWTEEGSPLVVTSKRQQSHVQEGTDLPIYLAMRYGQPSIPDIVQRILDDGIEHLLLVPLYPQYAMSSYETVVVRVMEEVAARSPSLRVDTLQPFYAHPEYLAALTESVRPALEGEFDKLVFSFHGVPERQIRKSDPSHAHCLRTPDCCHVANPAHATCYRHQCVVTAELLAQSLGLRPEQWVLSFQSRLLRDPWLGPATDETLRRLGREGHKRVKIVCPAFVTDCLETLEEIAEEGKEEFLASGGEDFELIPCLNEHPAWINFLLHRIEDWRHDGAVLDHSPRAAEA
jgi:protoporphyrin/coproporphyrin ferrochelatase